MKYVKCLKTLFRVQIALRGCLTHLGYRTKDTHGVYIIDGIGKLMQLIYINHRETEVSISSIFSINTLICVKYYIVIFFTSDSV